MRTCTPHRCISETAWPIASKFAVWLVTAQLRGFHMSCVSFNIAVCTCARADPISVSQKRLDRSRSNLMCGWEPIICYLITCHGWGVYLHVRPCNYKTQVAHPYLRNYSFCAENWFAVRRAYFHNNLGTFLLPCCMRTCTPIMLILEPFGRF